MQRRTIRWIIGLMSISLIGLIAFQLYWINSMISSNEERFKKDVHAALNTVVTKLERKEAVRSFQNTQYKLKKLQDASRNEPRASLSSNIENQPLQQTFQFQDTVPFGNGELSVFFNISQGFPYYSQLPDEQDIKPVNEVIREKDSKITDLENQVAKLHRKYEMTFDVVRDLMEEKIAMNKRFNPRELDSLLGEEFRGKGIEMNYNYGVLLPQQNQFLELKNASDEVDLKESDLKANLFPNDLFQNNTQLVVHFPERKLYLFEKIATALASAGVLVLVILVCFGYSIRTILQQKKLSEMKNDFINNMTHELKTPIATVSLAVEALNDKEIERSTLREKYVSVIGEENQRLAEQVEKVLQIAAIEKNDYSLKKEMLRMNDMAKVAAEHILIQIEKRGGRLNIIENAKEDLVEGDEIHITNIILNLLENANKYSPDSPNITLRTDSTSAEFFLTIQDHGIGMSKEQQRHIFEKFYRVPTGNIHNVKGFGLGLSYVHNMVQAHGGNIKVDSEPGKGSKFLITLPLVEYA